ncbi:MAG: redoxin family protein [Phycisphaerales bacterium]
MLTRHLLAAAIATAALTPAIIAQAPAAEQKKLELGDRAPKLENVTWHQGSIESFEPGKVYVLDFWAPWCGPCIAAMPHMNEITEQYKDKGVKVIGVSIWPREGGQTVAEFLEGRNERDEALKYLIAEDNADGTNANAFMRAAGQNGIPTVMIVNREGQIAWIGHPMGGMDGALEKIVAGTYDIAAEKAKMAKIAELQPQLGQAYQAQEWERLFSLIDQMIALDPDQFSRMNMDKYLLLITQVGDTNRAKQVGREIMDGPLGKKHESMNQFAWYIVNPDNGMTKEQRDLDLAMQAAQRAVDMTKGENSDVLDTMARVHFWKGDLDKAIEFQTKAIELADERMKPYLQEALDEYKEAAETR